MNERKNEIFENAGGMPTTNTGALSFDVPDIDVPLPSDGKVYVEGHPLHLKTSILIKSMTAAQENILTNKSLAKKGTLLTQLIQSCIKERAVNARDMLIGDRNTIMIALRASGYGPDYKVKITCPNTDCQKVSVQTFELDKLPIRRLAINPIEVGKNIFEYSLPQSKARVKFKFLTGADEEEIAMTQAQKEKFGASTSELVTSGLLQTIISINGVTDRAQISMALPRMPAFDSSALRRFIQDNEPGMQLKAPFTCESCDFSTEVDVPLGANFFWPGAE